MCRVGRGSGSSQELLYRERRVQPRAGSGDGPRQRIEPRTPANRVPVDERAEDLIHVHERVLQAWEHEGAAGVHAIGFRGNRGVAARSNHTIRSPRMMTVALAMTRSVSIGIAVAFTIAMTDFDDVVRGPAPDAHAVSVIPNANVRFIGEPSMGSDGQARMSTNERTRRPGGGSMNNGTVRIEVPTRITGSRRRDSDSSNEAASLVQFVPRAPCEPDI